MPGRRRPADAAGARRSPSAAPPREPTSTCCDARRPGRRPGRRRASRSRPTSPRGARPSVRVYEGEVEALTSAESEGVGIRVIVDGRRASPTPARSTTTAIAEALAEARDNAQLRHARRVGRARRARRRRAVAELDLWRDELARVPDRRQGRAGRSSSSGRRWPPTRGSAASSRRLRRRVAVEAAVATTTGIRRDGRETGVLRLTVHALGRRRRRDADRVRLRRRPRARTSSTSTRPHATRSSGRPALLGASQAAVAAAHGRARPVRHGASSSASSAARSTARRVAQGPLAVRRPGGRGGRRAARHARRRPDRTRLACTATDIDGEGLADPAQRARSTTACCTTFVHNSYTRPARRRRRPTGNAVRGGFKCTPGVGCLRAASLAARDARPRASSSPTSTTACSCRRSAGCTPASTRSAATSRPAPRAC